MAITEPIYDWPRSVIPRDQLLRVPGQAKMGGFTTGGARLLSPDVGGRAVMKMSFDAQLASSAAGTDYSWLLNKVGSGAIFRLPAWRSVQLVSASDLGVAEPEGATWDDGTVSSDGTTFAPELGIFTVAPALEGTTTVVASMGGMVEGLRHGHFIGLMGRLYGVDDIEYLGGGATIKVVPPLRKDVEVGDLVNFRPRMYGFCVDPQSFEAMFDRGRWARPGNVTFAEAII